MLTAGAALHHVLLALSILALASSALRGASSLGASGIERLVAAAVLATAAAVAQALLLGLVGLGSSPVALPAAAALTWLSVVKLLPAPAPGPAQELRHWWRERGSGERFLTAALAGGAAATAVWQLLNPSIGFDSSIYHYAEVAGWIDNGRPGSILSLSYDLPYGNYPVTDEVALTWMAGIARSFVPLSLWSWAMALLFAAASWATLRNVGAPRAVALAGALALVSLPLIAHQLNEPQTDVPALAWLACTAALATAAGREPRLLSVAVIGAGLAIGTKTTPVVPLAAALLVGGYLARASLPSLTRPLLLASVAALGVGGVWYLRNLVLHGSPLWPFIAAPWGDAQPAFLGLVDTSLIERPVATVQAEWRGYGERLAGGIVLLAGGLLVAVWAATRRRLPPAHRRALLVAGVLTVISLLAFALGPGTGLQRTPGVWFGPLATVRYLLPTVAIAVVALGLVSREGRVARAGVLGVLSVAAAWNLVEVVRLGAPYFPSAVVVLAGALTAMLMLAAAQALARRRPSWPRRALRRGPVTAALAAVLAGLVMAPFSEGYIERHAQVADSSALGRDVVAWFTSRPEFEREDFAIGFASRAISAQLAGDHFEHSLTLLPPRAGCPRVEALSRDSTVVVAQPNFLFKFIGVAPFSSGRCLEGRPVGYRRGAFTVYRPSGSLTAESR